MRIIVLVFCLSFINSSLYGQEEKPIQLHGIVVSNDSLKQLLPNVQILVKSRGQMTISDLDGFFSVVAMPGDTLFFQHIGFKLQKFWVADTLKGDEFLSRVVLEWDTEILDPVIVYPWPSKENFKEEFLAMEVQTNEMDIAQRNLALDELRQRAAAMGYDAAEMQDYLITMQNQQLYNEGRVYGNGMNATGASAILGALSNPFAWQQLFQSLKR
ncbi:MAG: hypothetical protein CMP53_04825 [Flavobacteriales bacterium]|nr:hypothetical protein [Flavobacteriales bacterium]|tara:strand:+ start:972 stop:1613 length:642 start_codon:yes stop_codon:yes gene_type:complete